MRLVLLEIPDNEEADTFVEAIKNGEAIMSFSVKNGDGSKSFGYKPIEGAKVAAVWAKPTQFCTCPDYDGKAAPTSKYRWLVHPKCAKPRPGAMQHPKDLTRVDWKPQEIPYYIGFRSDGRGWVYRKEER